MKNLLLSALIMLFFFATFIYSQNCADSANIYSFEYDGKTYEIVKENKSWVDAVSCAVERGGYLAEINSQEEQDSLYFHLQNAEIVVTNTVAPDGGGASYVWIGGNDITTEGKWIWDGENDGEGSQFWQGTTSGNSVDGLYNNWGNEPDNWENQDGLGLAITDWPLGIAGQWNDVDDSNSLYFIIEIDIPIGEPTLMKGSFNFDGHNRTYEVYLPHNFTSNMPLVISIHGITETVAWYKDYTRMHETANTMGYVIVYPQGIGNSWNTGMVNPMRNFPNTDDVGFFSALVDTMKSLYDIDLSRVYCCGFSLGGMMSFRLIGDLGYRFAAVGAVSGTLFGLADTWNIVRPFPVLHMHGTSDNLIFYGGIGDRWAAQKTIDYWIDKNSCVVEADTFNFPDIAQNDNCTIQKISYANCAGGSQVVHYKGIGMGHSWPNSSFSFGINEGNKNMDINANEEILNFFNLYQNPLVNIAYGKTIQCYPKFISTLNNNTIDLVANIHNQENHEVDVHATILLGDSVVADSIILYDDGLHNDELASDNIFGSSKQFTYLEENIYSTALNTKDLVDSISILCPSKEYFTNAGPVVWKDYVITQQNDSAYTMKVTLENLSTSFTVPEISAELSTNDSNVTEILSGSYNPQSYPDIEPGESAQSIGTYGYLFYINDNFGKVEFALNIYSNNHIFWTDTMMVDLVTDVENEILNLPNEYKLSQNYPNPFNPNTTIKYSIPRQSNVSLKVFDVLGSEIVTLLNKEQPQGNYQIELD